MAADKIIIVTSSYDQADILENFIEWYLHLGADLVLVQDCNSSDGSQNVLRSFAGDDRVRWFSLPERDMRKYPSDMVLTTTARDRYGAEWIIQCDVDEFLRPEGDLKKVLESAKNQDLTVLNVPCFNMTGPLLEPGQRAPQVLTLRIDQPTRETHQQQLSGDLPVPYIFIRHPPKTIVRAAAFAGYEAGTHAATSKWGQVGEIPQLRFLHYPIRGFDKLQKKVSNTKAWLKDNPHLQDWKEWGWHWRRWIRLNEEGRLREDYEDQFVSPVRGEELVRDGICTTDDTVANWLKIKAEPFV
jgi:hypothetical protein